MKIYIAAPWKDRELAKATAAQLEGIGHSITHKWWKQEADNENEHMKSYLDVYSHEFLKECALDDRMGVFNADAMLLLDTQKSEGKAVEQGLAIAYNIPIIAVGRLGSQSMNVFHHLDNYQWVETIDDAIEKLEAGL